MAEEDYPFDNDNAKPNDREGKRRKKERRQKKSVKDSSEIEEEDRFCEKGSSKGEPNGKFSEGKEGSVKRKKRKSLLKRNVEGEEEHGAGNKEGGLENVEHNDDGSDEGKRDKEEEVDRRTGAAEEEENVGHGDEKEDKRKIKRKRRLLKEAAEAEKRGICYLSRIPPHMDPFKLRQLLSQYGDIQRIYLTPENPAAQVRRKPGGRRQEQGFSEGWVEFSDKRIAKRVANMLNGEQIGGRKRSSFYYDLWNIKYLSKFKWDDLTGEIAYKSAIREQKLALEISAAKKERDFYLSKVDKARALSSIEERLKKKQKLQEESGTNADLPVSQQAPKVVRKFPQKKPVADNAAEAKPRLSKDILSGVFGGS